MGFKYAGVINVKDQRLIEQRCVEHLQLWSAYWFGCEVQHYSFTHNNTLFSGLVVPDEVQHNNAGIALGYKKSEADLALFEWAIVPDVAPGSHEDMQIVHQFSSAVISDLVKRMEQVFVSPKAKASSVQWLTKFTFILNKQPINLWLDVDVILHQLPCKTTSELTSTNMLSALKNEKVTLSLMFPEQGIHVSELMDLSIGSVIRLPQSVSEPIRFSSNKTNIALAGYLVNQGDSKAIYLTGKNI